MSPRDKLTRPPHRTQPNSLSRRRPGSCPNFLLFNSFFNKIYIWPLRDLNSSLDPGVGAINPGAEVTRLGATDLGVEVPDRAQKKILRVWYLGARIYGAELDAAAMYRLQILRPSEER